eukprot:jgi/Mesvir1/26566/Mv16221-RA.1
MGAVKGQMGAERRLELGTSSRANEIWGRQKNLEESRRISDIGKRMVDSLKRKRDEAAADHRGKEREVRELEDSLSQWTGIGQGVPLARMERLKRARDQRSEAKGRVESASAAVARAVEGTDASDRRMLRDAELLHLSNRRLPPAAAVPVPIATWRDGEKLDDVMANIAGRLDEDELPGLGLSSKGGTLATARELQRREWRDLQASSRQYEENEAEFRENMNGYREELKKHRRGSREYNRIIDDMHDEMMNHAEEMADKQDRRRRYNRRALATRRAKKRMRGETLSPYESDEEEAESAWPFLDGLRRSEGWYDLAPSDWPRSSRRRRQYFQQGF